MMTGVFSVSLNDFKKAGFFFYNVLNISNLLQETAEETTAEAGGGDAPPSPRKRRSRKD